MNLTFEGDDSLLRLLLIMSQKNLLAHDIYHMNYNGMMFFFACTLLYHIAVLSVVFYYTAALPGKCDVNKRL